MFCDGHLADAFYSERLLAVAGQKPQRIAGHRKRLGSSQPRDRLIAVDVVDEDGVVGLDDDEDAAANGPLAAAVEADETVSGDYSDRHGRSGRVSVFKP